MNTLNFINPELSDLPYKAIVFPDGQPHLKLDMERIQGIHRTEPLRIVTRIANANDLLLVLFAKNALDYLEFEHIELHISYLLAARMDRVMQDGEPFSLKVVAGILNGGSFKKVTIFDPHSEVSTAVIDRCYAIPNHQFVKDALDAYWENNPLTEFCIVSPDSGALKKIHSLAHFLNVENVVECMKERDVKTGALTNFKTTTQNLDGKTCFIIDDICDGGGTFGGTAKMLRQKGAGTIILVVSHGIFSKKLPIEGVDAIYTTDSFKKTEGVSTFSVENYLV